MQSFITLKKILRRALGTSLPVFLLVVFSMSTVNAQTTLTTSPPYPITSANAEVTFNFTNNNAAAISITGIGSVVNLLSGSADVSGFYKPGAIAGPPGIINAANGWIQFGSATVTANGTVTVQPFFTSNLNIPAGSTYGIAIRSYAAGTTTGALAYSNAPTPATITAGGTTFTSGANVGYAGGGNGIAPTVTPRGFTGFITFITSTPCSGTPTGGNTNSSVTSSCTGVGFNISASATAPVGTSGLTYQLQSSPTIGGTYTNVGAATVGSTFNVTQTVATAYRIIVTCANGGGTATYAPILVPVSTVCYCAAGSNNTTFEKISNVTFAGINRATPVTNNNGYISYLTDTAQVIQGAMYPISVTGSGTYANDVAKVWIDFNQDGDFVDVGENVYTSGLSAGPYTGTVTVPVGATLGFTRMRVRLYDASIIGDGGPCGNNAYGSVQDFTVKVNPCVQVTFTTQPTAQSAVCQGNATFTAAVNANGSLPVYQWQFRTSSTGVFQNVPNSAPYSGVNTTTLTITSVSTAMNGYEYRLSVSGACTASNPSNAAALTITPIVATVTPASAAFCLGGVQQLTITNIASPTAGNVTVNSTFATPIAIPDAPPGSPTPYPAAVLAGINTTLAVTVPAGATVTGVSVRVSGTHTYVGDLVMSLKAPNNNVVNLDYFLSGTGGGVSTAFTNTVITSNTTAPALSTATAASLYTGTYKADLVGAAGLAAFGNSPGGPTGFLPTGTSFTPLFTPTTAANASGNWTLAIYDGGAGDAGTLNNWSITVNYLLGAPATGVFSGPAGTIFTNAGATTAYTGTAINTVFVKPTTVGVNNYTVVVTDAACSSNPLTIPITVNAAVAGTATLDNATVCQSGNVRIGLGGTRSGPLSFIHQYQVSTNNGVSYTNITNGGVYSGATTDTLILTKVPLSFNGYKFRDSISSAGACGSLISTVSTLTVNPLPVVSISAAPIRNLFPGLTTTLTAAVTSVTPPVTYQWLRNGVAVPGATNNTLVVGIDQLGTYTVRATALGCTSADSTTTPKSIIIGDSVGVTTLFIYPSPNTGKFQVRYFNDINMSSPSAVNVFDSRGVRVFSRRYVVGATGYNAFNVDLGAHGKGIYRVELVNTNGERIKTGSVMVF